ncbi:CpaE family protein [Terrabacter sp. BE26]|uniref:AAA family ATPase n=1 Tax=Terrabacter sp. BE26 TaxID=2898152 RepID=UPI0035BE1BB8
MTILWDPDPSAADKYRYAVGQDVVAMSSGPQVARAIEDNAAHTLVVVGPDVDLDAACELADAQRLDHPHVGVVLLRHRLEVAVLANALRSGIREVVQADDSPALAEAVRRSRALTAQLHGHQAGGTSREAKVVTVFSAKGGVGKTTLATNVAAYLAGMHSRTLLIDLDLMFGDVAISLQLLPSSSIRDLVAMSGHLDREGLASVVTTHEASGLHVLAAPDDPAEAERIPAALVAEILRVARAEYDYVVVDTPPSFTEHVLTAFDSSDLTLLIATLDIPAIKNLKVAINTLDTLGTAPEARCIVLNRSDAKVGLTADDVESALGASIAVSIPNSVSVPAATNRGVAIILSEPRSTVSLAMRHLADTEIRIRFGEQLRNGIKRNFGLLRSKR